MTIGCIVRHMVVMRFASGIVKRRLRIGARIRGMGDRGGHAALHYQRNARRMGKTTAGSLHRDGRVARRGGCRCANQKRRAAAALHQEWALRIRADPGGTPLRVICTLPENPFSDCTLTWIPELVVPWLMVVVEGETVKAKSGMGGGGESSPVFPPPQPAPKTPAKVAQKLKTHRQIEQFVMRGARNQFGAVLPRLRRPQPAQGTMRARYRLPHQVR